MKKEISVKKETTTVTVKRPNGNIETIDVTKNFPIGINSRLLETIKRDTAAAGRGTVLNAKTETIEKKVVIDVPENAVEVNGDYYEPLENGNFKIYSAHFDGSLRVESSFRVNAMSKIKKHNKEALKKLFPTEWAMSF